PNPSDQFAFLEYTMSLESITVLDMSGRNITSQVCLKKLGDVIQLDLSSLQKGQYLVRDGHTVYRLLKR
ncbi:MAG: T9SS type A sorting domain-containing protein, partial [Cytophagales bacterium]|nr:T9SS type A sorting domain-containing protein [Cytophagales bacterium]